MVLHTAVRLALSGHFELTRNGDAFTSYLNSSYAAWLPQPLFYRPWVYPPSFLIVLLPFGLLGFVGSYVAFQLVTASLLAGALIHRASNRRTAWVIAAAALVCPAASINVVDGQCGFLVAGLLVLGLRLLPDRPFLAGAVLGLLSVKPQFALLVPFALLAMRDWRAMAGAAAASLALAGLSAALFGPEPWTWWVGQTLGLYGTADPAWATFGRMWGNSVYTCAVLLDVPPRIASAFQAIAIAGSGLCVYLAYRSHRSADRKLAILLACTILAAPHSSTYDAELLAIAGVLWLAGYARPTLRQGILALVLWVSPFLGPPLLSPIGRVMPIAAAGFIAVALRSRPIPTYSAGTD